MVAAHAQDSGTPGALAPARLAALSAYLRAHQGAARDEAAFLPVAEAGGVVARDARPVLMLAALGHPLVSTRAAAVAARGAVRTAVVGTRGRCSADALAGCSPPARWMRAHGVDVSAAAGQPHRGTPSTAL